MAEQPGCPPHAEDEHPRRHRIERASMPDFLRAQYAPEPAYDLMRRGPRRLVEDHDPIESGTCHSSGFLYGSASPAKDLPSRAAAAAASLA